MTKIDLIDAPAAEWTSQRAAMRLCGRLMEGTAGMRREGAAYLPRKLSETPADYQARLASAHLDNFFQKTIVFYLGQVFKKELAYRDAKDDVEVPYDRDWFEGFQENVDLAGSNLTVFGKRVFEAGLVDGVTFVLADFVRLEMADDPETGRLWYRDPRDGDWRPKTGEVDDELGLQPYLIHVRAEQVLDAWTATEGGRLVVKHFRYVEAVEEPRDEDGLDRETVSQVIAWWPHKWEKWRIRDGSKVLAESGPNRLGAIPLAWFRPGRHGAGLTAAPPLDDLAEINRAYWAASSDHDGRLMPFVRSPAFFGKRVRNPDQDVVFGPSKLLLVDDALAELKSVGVDSASAVNSQEDLRQKREAMRDYGLQTVQGGVTATMSENVATNASSSLKGWCANFKDCLENAHRYVARYQGWDDGPPVLVNTEFKNSLDLTLLDHLRQAAGDKIILPEYYVSQLLSMMPFSDEWTVDTVLNPEYGKGQAWSADDFGWSPAAAGTTEENRPAPERTEPAPAKGS